jgi:hypothetical protein
MLIASKPDRELDEKRQELICVLRWKQRSWVYQGPDQEEIALSYPQKSGGGGQEA